MKTVKFFSVGL